MKKLAIFHIYALPQLYVKQNQSYLRLDPPRKIFWIRACSTYKIYERLRVNIIILINVNGWGFEFLPTSANAWPVVETNRNPPLAWAAAVAQ